IREELKSGKQLAAAIAAGFERAFTAIFDSNVTTILTALVLFIFGSGPIRGFAVVLMIGIVTSVFTAVTLTRMWVAGWVKRTRPQELVI
ncbi:MAG TPA: MMPL family transporter, partial [Sphingorhabdus lacus]|nr:MMPL family transporter [Sphingorhabdus lacus]